MFHCEYLLAFGEDDHSERLIEDAALGRVTMFDAHLSQVLYHHVQFVVQFPGRRALLQLNDVRSIPLDDPTRAVDLRRVVPQVLQYAAEELKLHTARCDAVALQSQLVDLGGDERVATYGDLGYPVEHVDLFADLP